MRIDINPIAFSLGPVHISWYGIMVALGVMAVVGWVAWEIKKGARISYDALFTTAIIAIPSAIVFSKLLHVIDQWNYYIQNPGRILSGEGLTIWGAVLGATIGAWIYSLVSRQFRFSYFGDVIAPGIILAQAIGRVGCTLNGCCYGSVSDLDIAVVYENPGSYAPLGIPVIPTQIFEIIYDLLIFGILFKLRGRLKPEGSLFAVYYALYAVWRFGIDFIRDGTPFLFGLHQAQVIALIILIITLPLIAYRTRWVRPSEKLIENNVNPG